MSKVISVIICEDDWRQRQTIEMYVKNYIMMESLDMELAFSTGNPLEVIEFVKSNPKIIGLYFLDVDLQHEMSGLTLAAEIRKYDDLGKIVFVTTHGELSYLTFTYKVEAMDYIIKDNKDDLQRKICENIQLAHERVTNERGNQKRLFKLKDGDTIRSVDMGEIIFFESSSASHKIVLHLENGEIEFYGSLKDIEEQCTDFYRCHKSYLINRNHINKVIKSERIVKMSNGEECLVSVRAMKNL
ncbi:LytR/AlgR family response regulator transcription factor [Enterococcus sp. AZ192]|uniref:LytR/AlgR family response regulator transcription factor n=1 Tax=unclassified Enterococcus TaxID=2608891 RepID=UPI003D27744D